ncbi:MAG TPA: hypothetical protein VGL97_15460 [Bryobacteraceae bacterium]
MIRRISVVSLGLTLTLSLFARDEYTRSFDKTLAVRSGERIVLEHKLGDIVIHTHPQQEATIHAVIRVSASDSGQAKQFADRVEILVEPASELSIRTRYPDTPRSFFGMQNISFSVHYDLTVPENSPLEVRNAFGSVSATGVKASSVIATSHGDLSFRDGRGAQRLENSFARVDVANNVGDVSVQTNNGAVDAANITGGLTIRDRFASITVGRVSNGVDVSNSNGAVQVTESGGSGNVTNSFGEVAVRGFRGDLTVNNSNGRVEATGVSGSANLRTTFGEVTFSDIGHQLSIRANNSRISGSKVGGPLTIVNSFGAIDVTDVRRDVHIESGNGGVSLENVGGAASVRTSFGLVQATAIGGELSVENSNGGVKASGTQGAQITTSFGPVILDGVSGPIQIQNQNGAVEAASTLHGSCQPIAVRTSFSALRIHLQPDASYRVIAKTSFGKIRSDFPLSVSGSLSNDDLDGVLGGGHCEMRLTDNNGNIEILKASH